MKEPEVRGYRCWDFDKARFRKPIEMTQLVVRMSGMVTDGGTLPNVELTQWTGLFAELLEGQRRGQRIFEKDIVEFGWSGKVCRGKVVWDVVLVRYKAEGRDGMWYTMNRNTSYKIVGNAYENPERIT